MSSPSQTLAGEHLASRGGGSSRCLKEVCLSVCKNEAVVSVQAIESDKKSILGEKKGSRVVLAQVHM